MKKALTIVACCLALCSSAFAAGPDSVQFVCEEWAGYTNEDGTGAYWEVVKAIYEPLGIKVETRVLPWKRVQHSVKTGKADALVGDYYYADVKEYLYPKWHISVEDPVVGFIKKGNLNSWETAGVKALAGKRVVWIRGYDFDKGFLKGINVVKHEVADCEQGVRLVQAGREDVLLDYESHIRTAAKDISVNVDKDFRIVMAKPGAKLFAVFANKPSSHELIKIFDQRMNELSESGEIERIYAKWGLPKEKFAKDRFGK